MPVDNGSVIFGSAKSSYTHITHTHFCTLFKNHTMGMHVRSGSPPHVHQNALKKNCALMAAVCMVSSGSSDMHKCATAKKKCCKDMFYVRRNVRKCIGTKYSRTRVKHYYVHNLKNTTRPPFAYGVCPHFRGVYYWSCWRSDTVTRRTMEIDSRHPMYQRVLYCAHCSQHNFPFSVCPF